MEGLIITQGITIDQLRELWREDFRNEMRNADNDRLRTITKNEARRMLGGIHFKTLERLMEIEGITEWTTAHIDTIRLKYPKYKA